MSAPALPPSNEDVEALKTTLTESGVPNLEAAMQIGIKDHLEGKWTLERLSYYPYRLKEEHPELWKAQPTTDDLAAAELELAAFTANNAVAATARAKLVRLVGEDKANVAARAHGLTGIGDFKRVGKAPANADDKGDDQSKDKNTASKNPWKLPPGAEADAARAAFIRSVGTKAAAGLAKAAGVDLAGRPLRAA
jgi:hypothetical protein